ncbi:MAG: class I SAM-dependent methyltransferase, partial [Rhodospirillaceae bacterium]|nr:class I SAM-dependent methyltransferase [Rhodospirillaceae bacterium]
NRPDGREGTKMTLSNRFPDRGKIGPTPAVTARADESFLDYIKDVRSALMMGRAKEIHPQANAAIRDAGLTFAPTASAVEAIRGVIRERVPEAGVWARVYRSTQEAFWNRVADSYDLRREDFLRLLDEWDTRGPGSVQWDPNYEYPIYSRVETHRQPGGYVGDPLAGLRFDYGTRVFHGKVGDDDALHKALAAKAPLPLDGRAARIMDIGCAIGELACELKRRFPDSEVWGSDISAPMVRYAHYRAAVQNLDVHFIQKAAEDLDELPAASFDLVTVYILFHEVPRPVVDRTLANVFRLLRPGGTFWITDFPTLDDQTVGMKYTDFLGAIDSADNSEPYAPEFVTSRLEERLAKVGFKLRYPDRAEIGVHGRVCDKPA